MNYTSYKTILENAKLYAIWLITLAGAISSQMFSQMTNSQMVHLKVLN